MKVHAQCMPTRLSATFVMMYASPQERAVLQTLRHKLNVDVTGLENTAHADRCTFAVFVNPVPLRKSTRLGSRSVKFVRVDTSGSMAKVIGMEVPDWAKGAQGFLALSPLCQSDLDDSAIYKRLTDALRESCRICTRRVRQLDAMAKREAREAVTKQPRTVAA